MKRTSYKSKQRGAALIVGLVLLAVITLLAVVGMNISNAELASANSEQIRLRAFQAAETGLEHGMIAMKKVPTIPKNTVKADPKPVIGSPEDIDKNPIDKYTTAITYIGESRPSGFGQNFSGFNYSVVSEGISSRDAKASHESGAYLVNVNNQPSFGALPEE
jgi:Tfp pilus assembly protein PilX